MAGTYAVSAPPLKLSSISVVGDQMLSGKVPQGRQARELRWDHHQGHPGHGLVPQRVVSIYQEAERGHPQQQCDLFDDLVENDGHLRNLFEQRSQAVAGKPWSLQPGGSTEEDALATLVLEWSLRRLAMVPVWDHLLTYNRYGYSAVETEWEWAVIGGRAWVLPAGFLLVPARRFRITEHDELRLLTKDFQTDGEPLIDGKWIIVRRTGARIARQGLMRTAAWPALFKRLSVRDWVVYNEKFGLPFVLAKYDQEGAGTSDEPSKLVAEEAVTSLNDDGGAVLPKSIDIEVHAEGRTGDASGPHGGMITHCNREMSKLINGSTLSNDNGDSGGASYALGDTHDAVRFENVLYDAERLQESFRVGLALPFIRFNGLTQASPPVLHHQVVRDLTPRERVELAVMLARDLKIKLSKTQILSDTGFREPLDASDEVNAEELPALNIGGVP